MGCRAQRNRKGCGKILNEENKYAVPVQEQGISIREILSLIYRFFSYAAERLGGAAGDCGAMLGSCLILDLSVCRVA